MNVIICGRACTILMTLCLCMDEDPWCPDDFNQSHKSSEAYVSSSTAVQPSLSNPSHFSFPYGDYPIFPPHAFIHHYLTQSVLFLLWSPHLLMFILTSIITLSVRNHLFFFIVFIFSSTLFPNFYGMLLEQGVMSAPRASFLSKLLQKGPGMKLPDIPPKKSCKVLTVSKTWELLRRKKKKRRQRKKARKKGMR